MPVDTQRITQIRKELRFLSGVVDVPVFPTDTNRQSYLFTEIDSLMVVVGLVAKGAYKESFILLRAVLEKFLFFWLMFDGLKYKRTIHYTIEPRISKTPREARDKTLGLWNNLKNSGDSRYTNWDIKSGRLDNVIIVTYEEEGISITKDGKKTDEMVPYYNMVLEEYEPDVKHLSDIQSMVNNIMNHSNAANLTLKQNIIYNHYFYINNIYRNLVRNNLVNKSQLEVIRIHYNFLSKFVHPSKHNIELWDEIRNGPRYTSIYSEDILSDLVLLYVARLMLLYIRVFISGYKTTRNQSAYYKFEEIVLELDRMSKDFWFFDNDPTDFDIHYSNLQKDYLRRTNKKVPNGVIYNENPLRRLMMMRNQ